MTREPLERSDVAPEFDVLLVPGGYGQQELMNDEVVLSVIRNHFAAGRLLFSVCTGALLCGAAGVLRGRQATTHWVALNLLPYYGATPATSRVVVDGNMVTAAGVTAGLDAALVVVSLLGGDAVAQEIQLSIQYAPNPVFHSGTPDTAPAEVLRAFNEGYSAVAASREAEAQRFAAILGVAVGFWGRRCFLCTTLFRSSWRLSSRWGSLLSVVSTLYLLNES